MPTHVSLTRMLMLQTVWDSQKSPVSQCENIMKNSTPVRQSEVRNKYTPLSGTVRVADGEEIGMWTVTVDDNGTLCRDGSLGDMVAWAIEFEGKVIGWENSNNRLHYK